MLMINPTDETIRIASTCSFTTVVEPHEEVEVPDSKVELCQRGGLLPKDVVDALVKKSKSKPKTKPSETVLDEEV